MSDAVEYWLEIAKYDLDTADAMLSAKRYLYVGFMCHQVAEKTLKAIIASNNEFPPKSHNLIELAKKANITDELTDEQKSLLRELNPLNIEARYPSYIEAINKTLTHNKCVELLDKTKEWYLWIVNRL